MAMFSKRHYEALARVLSERQQVQVTTEAAYPDLWNMIRNRRMELDCVRDALVSIFTADNPRFDAERFNKACEPGGKQ